MERIAAELGLPSTAICRAEHMETNRASIRTLLVAAAIVLGVVIARDGLAQSPAAAPAPKMAEDVFENIQVLKGVPAEEVMPTMHFFSASLGVECTFCHDKEYAKDGNPEKLATKKMVQMMRALNDSTFDGRLAVTCYTCHRGTIQAVGLPQVSSREPKLDPRESKHASETSLSGIPSADQLLDKYLTALGGEDAIRRISSSAAKGTVTSDDGRKYSMEVFAKVPDKRIFVIHLSPEDSFTLYNGDAGWNITPHEAAKGRSPRDMWKEDIDLFKLVDPLSFAWRMKEVFSDLRVEPSDNLGEREVHVVSGLTRNRALVKLYFATDSGMLVRLLHYTDSPMGSIPIQVDYADYRNVDGVSMPFRWTIDEPRGLQPRFTYQLDEVQRNVPIDDSKFAMPAGCGPPRCSKAEDFKFGLPDSHSHLRDNLPVP